MQRIGACRTLLLFAAVLCLSCDGEKFAEGRQKFREMLTLRDAVAKEFNEKVVDVNLANGDRMTIKFIDSPFATAARDEKQRRADAVATFVATHYKHRLSSISVQFGSAAETYAGRVAPAR